jgi:D-serine deaminase-like pyridoxal phosphate-dependent protein
VADLDPREPLRAVLAAADPPLRTPALVIDLDAAERNIAAVIAGLGGAARWRPHVKTIKQSRLIALLLDADVRTFKCATRDELALVLGTADRHGVLVDVLLAYPLALHRVPDLLALAARHPRHRIGVLADDPEHLVALTRAAAGLESWIDVDVGMHRTGASPSRWREAIRGARPEVRGVHGYEGHLGWDDRERAWAGYDVLVELARTLELGEDGVVLTSGSHGFAHACAHPALGAGPWQHQLGCGTLVLSDLASQRPADALGVAPAAFVASRVIAHPCADLLTVDAGSKAIAPDRSPPACIVLGHPELVAERASEEHLPLRVHGDVAPARDELLLLVPDHVCTTVNLYRHAIHVRGDRIVGVGAVEAAGRPAPWDEELY